MSGKLNYARYAVLAVLKAYGVWLVG